MSRSMTRQRAFMEVTGVTVATIILMVMCWFYLVLPPLDGDLRLTPEQKRDDLTVDVIGYAAILLAFVSLSGVFGFHRHRWRFGFVVGVTTAIVCGYTNIFRYRTIDWIFTPRIVTETTISVLWMVGLCWWMWSLERRIRESRDRAHDARRKIVRNPRIKW